MSEHPMTAEVDFEMWTEREVDVIVEIQFLLRVGGLRTPCVGLHVWGILGRFVGEVMQ